MQHKISTLINWNDLNNTVIVKVDRKFQQKLLLLLIKKAKSKTYLSRILHLNRSQILRYEKGISNFSVGSLKDIVNYLKLDPNKLTLHVVEVGRKYKKIISPKLPFDLHSFEGVALRSIVNSEGHMPPLEGLTFVSKVPERKMLEDVIKFSKSVFGETDIRIQKTKDKNTFEVYISSIIADCLKLSGVVGGKSRRLTHMYLRIF